jgi:hypothetical protein
LISILICLLKLVLIIFERTFNQCSASLCHSLLHFKLWASFLAIAKLLIVQAM